MKPEDVYGYHACLEYAGAEVHAFEEFGSYQGDWWAKVTYNGSTGWIHDYYGSCSGCDSFEAEFSYNKPRTDEALRAFAADYLGSMMSQEDAEKEASKHERYDLEADKVIAFIKGNAIV